MYEEEIVKTPIPEYKPNIASEREVHDALIQAAKNVDRAFLVYTEINNAAKSEELTYEKIRQANWRVNHTPAGLERTDTFNYEGPIRPLMNKKSKNTDYVLKFFGELPPEPIMVSIVADNDSLIDIIRDVAAKTDGVLDIDIYEDSEDKIIEVIYVDRFK